MATRKAKHCYYLGAMKMKGFVLSAIVLGFTLLPALEADAGWRRHRWRKCYRYSNCGYSKTVKERVVRVEKIRGPVEHHHHHHHKKHCHHCGCSCGGKKVHEHKEAEAK